MNVKLASWHHQSMVAMQFPTATPSWHRRRPAPQSFYLHGAGDLDFRRCSSLESARLDGYGIDAVLVPRLYDHPLRTLDRLATDLHILAIAPSLCITCMDRAARAARTLPEWRNLTVHMWFIEPHYNSSHMRSAAATLASRPNTHMFSLDAGFGRFPFNQATSRLFERSVIIPYLVRQPLLSEACMAKSDLKRRRLLTLFHGDTGRFDGGMRGAVRDIMASLPSSSFVSTFKLRRQPERLRQQYAATMRDILDARFCFAPAGDTLSSGRLFEVMAAGCLPILVQSNTRLQHLPFPQLIDWRALVTVIVPESASLAQRHAPAETAVMAIRRREAANLLRAFSTNASDWDDVQRRNFRVACTVLNPFAGTSLVEYMLDAARVRQRETRGVGERVLSSSGSSQRWGTG